MPACELKSSLYDVLLGDYCIYSSHVVNDWFFAFFRHLLDDYISGLIIKSTHHTHPTKNIPFNQNVYHLTNGNIINIHIFVFLILSGLIDGVAIGDNDDINNNNNNDDNNNMFNLSYKETYLYNIYI